LRQSGYGNNDGENSDEFLLVHDRLLG